MARVKRKVIIEEVNVCDWCKQEVDELKDGQFVGVMINGKNHTFDLCQPCWDQVVDRLMDDSGLPAEETEVPAPPEPPENETQTSSAPPKKKRRGRPPGSKNKKKTTTRKAPVNKKTGKKTRKKTEPAPEAKAEPEQEGFVDPADNLDLSQKNDTRVIGRVVEDSEGNQRVVNDVVPGKALGDIVRAAQAVSPAQAKEAANYDAAEAAADGNEGMVWDPVLRCYKFPVDITRGDARRKMAKHYEAHNDAIEKIASSKSNKKVRIRPEG